MPVTVTMPQLGETVTEGTILSWAKQVGEAIAEDEVLVEISTDKVDTEMPSPASGVISEILVQAGETVVVGTAIVVIGEADEAAIPEESTIEPTGTPAMGPTGTPAMGPTGTPEDAMPASVPPAPAPVVSGDSSRRAILSPVVRRLADEHKVDLDLVPGSGDGGRITRKD
ncbi:MAG: biotin/lipoyl-containing protein, partial [Actinomycetota bacterium]|nr:biotin/lipoyl-containing protein [Actinomycetota bacterium]